MDPSQSSIKPTVTTIGIAAIVVAALIWIGINQDSEPPAIASDEPTAEVAGAAEAALPAKATTP